MPEPFDESKILEFLASENVVITDDKDKGIATISLKDQVIPLASIDKDGLMSKEDKIKLDNLRRISENSNENSNFYDKIDVNGVILEATKFYDIFELKAGNNIKIDTNDSINTITISPIFKLASSTEDGLMSKEDKAKLDSLSINIEENQNLFTEIRINNGSSVKAGNKFDLVELIAGKNINLDADITNKIIEIKDITPDASIIRDGLVTYRDKIKLDSINEGAEENQNLFNKVVVNTNNLLAKNKNDKLTLVAGKYIEINSDIPTKTLSIKQVIGLANEVENGLMSAAQKTKLDSLQENAEVNVNSFTRVKIGNSIINPTNKNDTLEIINKEGILTNLDNSTNSIEFGLNINTIGKLNKRIDPITGKLELIGGLLPGTHIFTNEMKDKINSLEEGAEDNQFSFSKININGEVLEAQSKGDTLEIVPDLGNDCSMEIRDDKIYINIEADENEPSFTTIKSFNSGIVIKPIDTNSILTFKGNDKIKYKMNDDRTGFIIDATGLEANIPTISWICVSNNNEFKFIKATEKTDTLTFKAGEGIKIDIDENNNLIDIGLEKKYLTQNYFHHIRTAKDNIDIYKENIEITKPKMNTNGSVFCMLPDKDQLELSAGRGVKLVKSEEDGIFTINLLPDEETTSFKIVNDQSDMIADPNNLKRTLFFVKDENAFYYKNDNNTHKKLN